MVGGVASAQTSTTTTATSSTSSDDDRIICRTGQVATGTRLGAKRVCQTKKQWDDLMRDSQQEMMRNQMQGIQQNPPGG